MPLRLSKDHVVAKWNGGQMTYGELVEKRSTSFNKVHAKYLKELHQLEQQELEGTILQQLVGEAAKAAGKSEQEYLASSAGTPTISDQEIAEFYEKNAKQSGQPLEALKDRIKQYLTQTKQQEGVRKEFERLKTNAKLVMDLPAPEGSVAKFNLEGKPVKGNPNAKVTVVEFSDFECPYCSRAVSGIEALVKAYPNDVKVYFLHFPLSFHQKAMPAAIASTCANKQGKFWPFHDKLFSDPSNLDPGKFAGFAKEMKMDEAKFTACINDPATKASVEAEMKQGEGAGVEGTPSFFINGVQYTQGVPTPEAIKPFLDQAKK